MVLLLGWPASTRAQNEGTELRVATFVLPPFVIQNGDQLSGFSIDLWEEVAARLKVKSSFTIVSDPSSFLALVQSKNVDIGVSAVYFTTEHDKVVDFTYPILNMGLQVMVRDSGGGGAQLRPLRDWLQAHFSRPEELALARIPDSQGLGGSSGTRRR